MQKPTAAIVLRTLPFVRQGATLLALATLLAGCECGSRFLVPVSELESSILRNQQGDGDLPHKTCDAICIPPGAESPDGGPPPQTASEAGFGVTFCHVVQNVREPAVYCEGQFPDSCIGGRRPARLADCPPRRDVDSPGARFARLARVESASVLAFVELAIELCAHRAPESLVLRALAAAVEEVRHARTMAALATRKGSAPELAIVAISAVRSFETMLADNAVSGLALEAWGAISAADDARAATDATERRALLGIAGDEAGHADLARAIDDWARPRARPAAQKRAREARLEAVRSLVQAAESGSLDGAVPRDLERTVARAHAFARAHLSA